MTRDEVVALCEGSDIEYAEVGSDFEHGAGMIFRWKNAPKETENEEVHVRSDALEGMTGPQLRKLVINGRDVVHITRIVGYFSHVQNWNKSKLGELKDRQAGNYSISEAR